MEARFLYVTAPNADEARKIGEALVQERLVACAPQILDLPDPSYTAINSWAFNVGTGAACRSTLIAKLKAGDLAGACGELSRWVRVKGQVIKGLVNRRVDGNPGRRSEQALCLEGAARRAGP